MITLRPGSSISFCHHSEEYPYFAQALPIYITIPSITFDLYHAISTRSSLRRLDLEDSTGNVRRVRSHHSPAPRPLESFDGRADRDYFGQKSDVSDMKVSARDTGESSSTIIEHLL